MRPEITSEHVFEAVVSRAIRIRSISWYAERHYAVADLADATGTGAEFYRATMVEELDVEHIIKGPGHRSRTILYISRSGVDWLKRFGPTKVRRALASLMVRYPGAL